MSCLEYAYSRVSMHAHFYLSSVETFQASSIKNVNEVDDAMKKAAELLQKVQDLDEEWAKASLLAHLKMEVEPLIVLPSQKVDQLLDVTVNMDVLLSLLQKYKEGLRNNILVLQFLISLVF